MAPDSYRPNCRYTLSLVSSGVWQSLNCHDILSSASVFSYVYKLVNFLYQPLAALCMKRFVELAKIFSKSILGKQVKNLLAIQALGRSIFLDAECHEECDVLILFSHSISPFCGYATRFSFRFGICGLCHWCDALFIATHWCFKITTFLWNNLLKDKSFKTC